ncbi:hypothetical protein HELRODRAFT_164259 [Helobdella robusta]|uniref:Uncharacterized protein n=1 Tax=Helobdella robusta TaxID=6412 RepID=T1EV63_HELRO|nr:hypothetical protein HELRODRAFT_164259 [Helobdella robusta]ESN94420.1 hypothetical protein HELRODRAFT_164259 [Helobdella robusta]
MEYKHKSGSQKRKEKATALENDKIGSRSLFQFGIIKEKNKTKTAVNFPTSAESVCPVGLEFSESHRLDENGNSDIQTQNNDSVNIIKDNDASVNIETVERFGFDVGTLPAGPIPTQTIETVIRNGPPRHPDNFPGDGQRAFPTCILKRFGELFKAIFELFVDVVIAIDFERFKS